MLLDFLVTRKGPLAQVWLASNMEKKVSKSECLEVDISASVEEIKGHSAEPMALRLSGQLLLGVATIYTKKAQYLYDDCADTMFKLRMAYKPGNVDLAESAVVSKKGALTLQNAVTELGGLLPDLPPELSGDLPSTLVPPPLTQDDTGIANAMEVDDPIMSTPTGNRRHRDVTLANFDASIEIGRGAEDEQEFVGDEEDLGLDFQLEEEEMGDQSIEIGRDAGPVPEAMDGIDLGLAGDANAKEGEDFNITMSSPPPEEQQQQQDEEELQQHEEVPLDIEPHEAQEEPRVQPSKLPRRKRTEFDSQTTLSSSQLQLDVQSLQDRAHSTRLPSHPEELSIVLHAQKGPTAFSELVYRQTGVPSLAAKMLNLNYIRQAKSMANGNDLRIQGVDDEEFNISFGNNHEDQNADAQEEGSPSKVPRLEQDELDFGEHQYDDMSGLMPEEEQAQEGENQLFGMDEADRDESAPASSTPSATKTGISQNTVRAAQILKGEMNEAGAETSFSHVSSGTGRSDKVKMFFELLVLSTKDAISVDQPDAYGDINIKSKPQLYNSIFSF